MKDAAKVRKIIDMCKKKTKKVAAKWACRGMDEHYKRKENCHKNATKMQIICIYKIFFVPLPPQK